MLEARPHAVRLLVPTDGSVPRVNEWQLRRRVARAPEGSHEPGMDAPIITESGLLMPGADTSDDKPVVDGDPFAGDEEEYAIDKIEYAQKVGLYYKIWIRWKGFKGLTWRWRHELVSETSNAESIEQIEAAVAHERVRCATVAKDAYAENEEEFIEDVPQDLAEQPEEPLGRGAPRERKTPTRFTFLMMDTSTEISSMTSTVRGIVSKRLRACTHYLQPPHAMF